MATDGNGAIGFYECTGTNYPFYAEGMVGMWSSDYKNLTLVTLDNCAEIILYQ